MTTEDTDKKCARTCWYIAVGVGLLLSIALIVGASWSFLWAVLFGVVAFLIFGFVLPQLVCTNSIPRPMASSSSSSSLVAGDPPAPTPMDNHARAASAAAATPPPSKDEATPPASEAEAAEPAPQAHPIAEKAEKPAPEPAPQPAADKSATAKDGDAGKKPKTLSAPRGGKADDLKMIRGVGPKLEIMLHGMGFYHYDQIAKWSDAEIAWVDQNLQGFKGRATRDDWKGQAETLASGGETEFSKRASKGDVY